MDFLKWVFALCARTWYTGVAWLRFKWQTRNDPSTTVSWFPIQGKVVVHQTIVEDRTKEETI